MNQLSIVTQKPAQNMLDSLTKRKEQKAETKYPMDGEFSAKLEALREALRRYGLTKTSP